MTSALVQKFRNDTARRLLAKFANGGVFDVLTVTTPSPDPLMPGTSTETRVEVIAVARGVSGDILTVDTNLTATDVQVIVAALDFTPTMESIIAINGIPKKVVRIDAIPAAGLAVIYRFYVR